jgi:hypothetical protein
MGTNGPQRREARRRAHPRTTPRTPRSTQDGQPTELSDVVALIDVAVRFAVASPRAAVSRIRQLNEIGARTDRPELDPAPVVIDQVLSLVGNAWERGWQPADLVHAARRRTSSGVATWLARAILIEAGRSHATERAPQEWVAQLHDLTSRSRRPGERSALLATAGRATTEEWTIALVALDLMRRLPGSQRLVPPPSQWGRTRSAPATAAGARVTGDRAKTLTRIRALLAKAESTEFAAEAEAFTGKAQDLMTRHAIDEALLAEGTGGSVDVQGIRVLIHHPYALEKAGLLDVIARANRSRAVWNDFASCMTVLGVPTDLAQVEMLFTSALVQATRAMTRAGQEPGSVSSDRSSAFRRAFLNAYAIRIGERLTASAEAATASYGTDLVPVFQRQAEAIDVELERLFPHITTGSRRAMFDARGWAAGTRAADSAVLPAGEVGA